MYWIITELFFPDDTSTANILTDIALVKNKQKKVSIICGPTGYDSTDHYQKRKLDFEINIIRVKLPKLNKNIFIKRLARQLILSFKLSWEVIINVKKGDTVLITTNPAFLLLTIPFLKKIKAFKLELLVHDVFPENLVPIGLLKKDSYLYNLLLIVFNYCYGMVDRIIVIGQDMRDLIIEKTGQNKIKIDTITNWHDDDICRIQDFDIKKYVDVDYGEKVVLSFAGNLGRVQGIIEFIELFKIAENNNLILIIIGDGAMRDLILKKINYENLSNIYYLGSKPRNEQNLFLNACNIGVVTLAKGMKGLGVPSKAYNIMAAGKPLLYIGDKQSEVDNYICNNDCGWSYSWEEDLKIINFIRELSLDRLSEINQKGERSYLYSKMFKKDKLIDLF